VVSGALAGVAVSAVRRPSSPLTWREARFPDDLDAEQVQALLQHVAAVQRGPVCFVVSARQGALRFLVGAPAAAMASIGAALSGIAPELRLDQTDGPNAPATELVRLATRLAWRQPWPLLRTDGPELLAAGQLGALSSVHGEERLELMVRLWPAGRVHRPAPAGAEASTAHGPWFLRPWWPAEPPRDELRAIRQKFSGLLVRTEVLVLATAAIRPRAVQLTEGLTAAIRASSGTRGLLGWQRVPASQIHERAASPRPWQASSLLSPAELVGVVAWPLEAPRVAGISYGVGPRLMPPAMVPSRGRVFAVSTWPGAGKRLLAQPIAGGLQHAAIVGPTGTGKSVLIERLVTQDLKAGRGALVMDIKGDLVSDLLARIPPRRAGDVIVLEPAASLAQPGLELFPSGGDVELTSDLILGTLRELFADSWGVRSSQYLGLGLRTLAAMPGSTLVDLPRLFSEPRLRARALASVRDPWLLAGWARFAALSAAEQAAHLASPLNKLEELTSRRRVRLVLGQRRSRLNFNEVLAKNRIVLVSLPPGLLGMPATRLLAALTLWQFFQAVEARASLDAAARRPFMAYIDEVGVLASLPLPLEGLFERARSHGVGLTVSPQALSQLSTSLRASLLANVGTLVAFRQTAEEEAKVLAKALTDVTPEQLQHLAQFEIALRLGLAPGQISPTMTGATLPPSTPCSDPAALRRQAAERYGAVAADFDAALTDEPGPDGSVPATDPATPGTTDGAPFGVTRRPR
jgi:hypothetical protein